MVSISIEVRAYSNILEIRLSNSKAHIALSNRVLKLKKELQIMDTCSECKQYIKKTLEGVWKALWLVQRNLKDRRESHMQVLAERYAERRDTTRAIEIKKMKQYEDVRRTAAKPKWYLKGRNGMIRTLLVPDYSLHQILAIIGTLACIALMGSFCINSRNKLHDKILMLIVAWGVFIVWSQLVKHDGWKVLTDGIQITKRLLQRNGTHLSILGDTPFVRGALAEDVGYDGEEQVVVEMLKGSYTIDRYDLDEVQASTEMSSFLAALKIPHSSKMGGPTPEMSDDITAGNYMVLMNKTREAIASSPSGIHYGHYKAACESEVLTAVNLIFMVIPFKVGIPLQRWACSLHCMI